MPVVIFEPMSSRSDEGSAVPSSLDSPTWLSSKERGEQQEINNYFANFFSQLVFIDVFRFSLWPSQQHISFVFAVSTSCGTPTLQGKYVLMVRFCGFPISKIEEHICHKKAILLVFQLATTPARRSRRNNWSVVTSGTQCCSSGLSKAWENCSVPPRGRGGKLYRMGLHNQRGKSDVAGELNPAEIMFSRNLVFSFNIVKKGEAL